ncbi:hypothetical protein ACFPA8_07035 [Streptomyces ovatisporus]|uniref:Secreted protein n=1 Tax=Streptomyces ovatisporus TaxID=1128682 RepID=A0ABV9A5L8_9ACTN
MKPLHLKGAAALAVAALVGVGYQTAFAGEPSPGKSASAGPASSEAAAAMDVAYYSESLNAELTDVAAVSKNEGWAIGTSREDDGGGSQEILLHRAGGKWEQSELPEEAADASLSQIEGSGPDNVWLFGRKADQSGSLAFRWNGEKWQSMPAPAFEGSPADRGAAVLAADDAWVLGSGKSAHHWDGTRWTESQLPADAASLAGISSDDVWAVGFRETSGDGGGPMSQPAAMHWDGKEWKLEKTPEYHFPDPAPPEESASLDSVVAVSGDEVWAVGLHTFNHGEGGPEPEEEKILLRWDGGEWQEGPADAAGKASTELAPDGAGGLVLGRYWHMTADGDLREIPRHKPVPGRSGQVEEVDKKQRFWPGETVHVPGTKQVWSTGVIELGAYGDANFRRGAILSYDAE